MKRAIKLAMFIAVALLPVVASAEIHESPCGKKVVTVDRDFFKDHPREWDEFKKELNEMLCGTPSKDQQDLRADSLMMKKDESLLEKDSLGFA